VPDPRSCHRLPALLIALLLLPAARAGADAQPSGVYVRDSASAVEKFALADRMQRLGEWGKAADVFQDLLQTQADRVVLNPDNPSQYLSTTVAVQQRLCHWPAEGLDVYRGRFEAQAGDILQQALGINRADGEDDVPLLHRVLSDYFVTDAGKTAGIRLMDLSIERGEFAAAAWIGQQLLDAHPRLLDDRPRVLFRLGLAHHLAGDDAAARQQLSELLQKYPNAQGKIAGADATLATALANLLQRPAQPTTASVATSSLESWPMPFGQQDRAALGNSAGFGGARIFSAAIDTSLPRGGIPAAAKSELKQTAERDRQQGMTLGVMPVVDRDELFFNDNVRVYALSLESGLPLSGWQQTYPADRSGCYALPGGGWPTPRGVQDSLCLTDDSVLAVMGQPDANGVNLTGKFMRDSRLVCLDRRNGRERWVISPRDLPAEPTALRQLDFVGSPLVVGDRVYFIARGGRGMQFEDCYIICLDVHSGEYRWSTYLASANNTAQMWEMDVAAASAQAVSHIAYSGGRLYVSTDVGAMAAIDAFSGSVIWLNLYPRSDDAEPNPQNVANLINRRQRGGDDGIKPWTCNPVIVRDGKVFLLPSDGSFLHVFDAGSGAEMQRMSLSMRASPDNALESVDTLVGVGGDRGQWLVLASDRSIFCVDWKNYAIANPAASLHWASTFAKSGYPDDSIRGRAFLTEDSVFVPLAWQLVRLSLASGAPQAAFPSNRDWDTTKEAPGNVLVTRNHLIIAGAQSVNVYTDIALATAKLESAIAAAPNDPEQRLRYAEVLCAAERYDAAAERLDQAAALLHIASHLSATSPAATQDASMDAGAPSPARARLFNDALTFAKQLQHENPDGAGELIDGFYDRAAVAAIGPADQVTCSLQRATWLHARNDAAGELALYQRILADPRQRSVTELGGESTASPAGTIARLAIADLIQRNGKSIYADYETQAASAVMAAQVISPPARAQQLISIAETYPNSSAATGAMLIAAEDEESQAQFSAAAALMRQFCSRYPQSPDWPRAIEILARTYLEMPNRANGVNVAIGRLEQGAQQAPQQKLSQPLKLPDGTQIAGVSFADAAAALRNFQAKVQARALPDPQIPVAGPGSYRVHNRPRPLPDDPTAAIDGALVPAISEWTRHDRVAVFSAHGFAVYAVGSATPLLTCPGITEAPRGVAWIGERVLVFCPSQLFLIQCDARPADAASQPSQNPGAILWNAPIAALPAAQLASAGGDDDDAPPSEAGAAADGNAAAVQPPMNGVVIVNGRRVILRNGAVVNFGAQLRIVNGQMIIGQPMPPNLIIRNGNPLFVGGGPVAINPIGVPQPGAPAGARANAPEQIDRVVPTDDRIFFTTLSADGTARIVCINLADGQVAWQTSLEGRQIDQLAANDDFAVLRASNDADVRLIAFDAASGQPVWHPHAFGRENNDSAVPVNCCLADDGSLVYLTSDHVCCKDLFDPAAHLRFDTQIGPGRAPLGVPPNVPINNIAGGTFIGATAADQLVISAGRILAVSDNGAFVRVYSLADGKPLRRGNDGEALLNTEVTASPWNVHLRVVGAKLYLFGPDKLAYYNLDDPTDGWSNDILDSTSTTIADLLPAQRDLLVLLQPNLPRNPGDATPSLRLRTYSRAPQGNGHESGMLENADRVLNEPTGITGVSVVDGGIYYQAGDNHVHFLRGGLIKAGS
jgi:outer membrane protein assembly factor BamB/tetratricopeptide (TPR) repeat protein